MPSWFWIDSTKSAEARQKRREEMQAALAAIGSTPRTEAEEPQG